MGKILIACEESQRVCCAMREIGHEAYSCDVVECSGGHPEWHIQQDVIPLINGMCSFKTSNGETHTINQKWDMIIAHPPCTYFSVAGNKWFDVETYGEKAIERARLRDEALEFFLKFVNADCDRIAIENPVGTISTLYRKPDCIVSPHMFGHPIRKKTCFWLKNLPDLVPTNIVEPELIHSSGKSGGYSGPSWYVKNENGKALRWADPMTAKIRSKTYPGIAQAIAEQWGSLIE